MVTLPILKLIISLDKDIYIYNFYSADYETNTFLSFAYAIAIEVEKKINT